MSTFGPDNPTTLQSTPSLLATARSIIVAIREDPGILPDMARSAFGALTEINVINTILDKWYQAEYAIEREELTTRFGIENRSLEHCALQLDVTVALLQQKWNEDNRNPVRRIINEFAQRNAEAIGMTRNRTVYENVLHLLTLVGKDSNNREINPDDELDVRPYLGKYMGFAEEYILCDSQEEFDALVAETVAHQK